MANPIENTAITVKYVSKGIYRWTRVKSLSLGVMPYVHGDFMVIMLDRGFIIIGQVIVIS